MCFGVLAVSLAWAGDPETYFLTFSAQDRHGIYLRDLRLEEVTLLLDEKPVDIGYLGSGNVTTAFAFFLENSPRTAPYLVSMPQRGEVNAVDLIRYSMAGNFLRTLVQMGSVLLGQFDRDIEVLQDFTQREDLLNRALHEMAPPMGFEKERIPVGRALGRGADLLQDRSEKRRMLVLVTTVVDRDSYTNLEEYREMLRLRNVELFVLSFSLRFPPPGASFLQRMNRYYFRHLVEETSGRGGPGKLDHLLRWLRPESERMRSHGKTKEFLSSV